MRTIEASGHQYPMSTCTGISIRFNLLPPDVEYAERGNKCGFRFISSLFCEYVNLEYVHIYATHRVKQAAYFVWLRLRNT